MNTSSQSARLAAFERQLRPLAAKDQLLTRAASLAAPIAGFDRGIAACVEHGTITAAGTTPPDDPASRSLYHRLARAPLRIPRGSVEAAAIHAAEVGEPDTSGRRSVLRSALGLREHVIAPVVMTGQAAALLVVDRDAEPVSETERQEVELHAFALGPIADRLVLRQRLDELGSAVSRVVAAAKAVAKTDLELVLSQQEREIAHLMTLGRSNKEIGAQLFMSPDTVKDHVSRLIHKLDASNRTEAVAHYVARGGT